MQNITIYIKWTYIYASFVGMGVRVFLYRLLTMYKKELKRYKFVVLKNVYL